MPERTHTTEQPHSPPPRRLIAAGWIRRAPQPAPTPKQGARRV